MTRQELVEHMMLGISPDCADHAELAAALLRGALFAEIFTMPAASRQPDTCEFLSQILDPLWQAEAGVK